MYLGGVYSKRITKAGAISGALVGFIASALWLLFMHRQESSALLLCQSLFGVPCLPGDARTGFILWAEVDPLVIALPLSLITTFLVSIFTTPLDRAHIEKCFEHIG
jgi:SSS family solute:Na+ symporter